MRHSRTYRIDIDGTIAEPRFYHEDLKECEAWYVRKGIITEKLGQFRNHHQLFLHPNVLLTHLPLPNAVSVLQQVVMAGNTLEYFTVRQSFQAEIRSQIHDNTKIWLEQHHFPQPHAVQFFWSPEEKLLKALEAPEEQILLIDDRATGLLSAYQRIKEKDLTLAQQIQKRLVIVAFGPQSHLEEEYSGELRIVPLDTWSTFFIALQQGETV